MKRVIRTAVRLAALAAALTFAAALAAGYRDAVEARRARTARRDWWDR